MLQGVVNKPLYACFYYGSVLTTPRASLYEMGGTLVTRITLTPSSFLANVYVPADLDDLVTIDVAGDYYILYEHNPSSWVTLKSEPVRITASPTSDFQLSSTVAAGLQLDEAVVGDAVSTVTLSVLDISGARISYGASYVFSAPYSATKKAYVASNPPISEEGPYFLLWYDDGVLHTVERVQGFLARDKELVDIFFAKTVGSATVAHTGCDVLVSDEDMNPLSQGTTDSSGNVSFELYPGDYVVTIRKSGVVFSTNNFELSVIDTDLATGNNSFSKDVPSQTPTWTDSSAPAGVSLCTLYARLYDAFGAPVARADIIVSPTSGSSMLSGIGVFGQGKKVTTDANGYVEFTAVQGSTLEIAITSNGARRRITVPASAGPENLITLMSAAEDMFDVTTPAVPTLLSRSV